MRAYLSLTSILQGLMQKELTLEELDTANSIFVSWGPELILPGNGDALIVPTKIHEICRRAIGAHKPETIETISEDLQGTVKKVQWKVKGRETTYIYDEELNAEISLVWTCLRLILLDQHARGRVVWNACTLLNTSWPGLVERLTAYTIASNGHHVWYNGEWHKPE